MRKCLSSLWIILFYTTSRIKNELIPNDVIHIPETALTINLEGELGNESIKYRRQ